LANAYNSAWFSELKLSSGLVQPGVDLYDEISNNKNLNQGKDVDAFVTAVNDTQTKLNIVINGQEGYLDQVGQDKIMFSNLQRGTNLLLGERGDLARRIVGDQLSYYQNEQTGNKSTLAGLYGLTALFTIWKDNVVVKQFSDAVGSSTDASYISKYFSELAPLEKYSSSGFKFEHEDLIKEYYPEFTNKIDNYKRYFASYYAAEKDFSVGNTDTAKLEIQSVIDNWANISIDYSSIFNETNSSILDEEKDTLKKVSDQAVAIKDYKSKKLYKYPLLPDISVWKEDLVLCQMYDFKTGIYHSITSKYPNAKTVAGLISEISTISPKTDNVDNRFDKSAMKFVNSDKKLEFTCIDKYSKTKLNYFITKN
jgi:hypothetical protein